MSVSAVKLRTVWQKQKTIIFCAEQVGIIDIMIMKRIVL